MRAADTIPILTQHLENVPIVLDPIEQIIWDASGRFTYKNDAYEITSRLYPLPDVPLYDPQVLTFRFLAKHKLSGEPVCMTTTPSDLYTDIEGIRPAQYIEGDLLRFFSEPVHLQKLAQIEQMAGTHYFPRLLSPAVTTDRGGFAYLMEYVPGISIDDILPDERPAYRDALRQAISVAHIAGIRFFDLAAEDLRILPDGQDMMLDFKMTLPGDDRPFPLSADYDRLDVLLACDDLSRASSETVLDL